MLLPRSCMSVLTLRGRLHKAHDAGWRDRAGLATSRWHPRTGPSHLSAAGRYTTVLDGPPAPQLRDLEKVLPRSRLGLLGGRRHGGLHVTRCETSSTGCRRLPPRPSTAPLAAGQCSMILTERDAFDMVSAIRRDVHRKTANRPCRWQAPRVSVAPACSLTRSPSRPAREGGAPSLLLALHRSPAWLGASSRWVTRAPRLIREDRIMRDDGSCTPVLRLHGISTP